MEAITQTTEETIITTVEITAIEEATKIHLNIIEGEVDSIKEEGTDNNSTSEVVLLDIITRKDSTISNNSSNSNSKLQATNSSNQYIHRALTTIGLS